MIKFSIDDFDTLRAANPSQSPEELYDTAAQAFGSPTTWATVPWQVCDLWLNNFANAPTSDMIH